MMLWGEDELVTDAAEEAWARWPLEPPPGAAGLGLCTEADYRSSRVSFSRSGLSRKVRHHFLNDSLHLLMKSCLQRAWRAHLC